MRSLFDETAQEYEEQESRPDADLTLGIGSLLSIFFGVILVCGIFFGFGYSMGRRNAHPVSVPVAASSSSPAKPQDDGSAVKPDEPEGSATLPSIFTSPAQDQAKTPAVADQPTATPAVSTRPARSDGADDAAPAAKPVSIQRDTEPATSSTALTAVPFTHRAPLPTKPHAGVMGPAADAPVADTPAATGRAVMVQIAAVSRQEDAEVLAGALRKRGFSPQVRGGTTDKFFHVQVGPFPDKATAETMKQHLLSDGYNAIVK